MLGECKLAYPTRRRSFGDMSFCECRKGVLKRLFILLSLYCVCAFAQAQYSDSTLFAAYLRTDMKVWDRYLHASSFEGLSVSEQKRYLSYEYGYVAAALDASSADAADHLASFSTHLDALASHLSESDLLVYRSSLAAYEAKHNRWLLLSKGLEAFRLANAAYRLAPADPFVLLLKGNVEFYAPKALGSKEQALDYYRRACAAFEAKGDTICNWQYLLARLTIIQCLDKLSRTSEAISEASILLSLYPSFAYLRDDYLPSLLQE